MAPPPAPSKNNFPLRWESTGDQWWYASPVDWAAANGHYDLVRQLLRLDPNHLFKLTSLRRIRRLESVWDEDDHDHDQFHGVAASRSAVARRLFDDCDPKGAASKNTLIRGGYGGWLLYTAASAGDLGFVRLLLERDPLLVFGEGEYGVTDVLYAAARSKNCDVFRLLFDFAASPRFSGVDHGGGVEPPAAYREEMVNRAVHAAARGGNLKILTELLSDHCSDVLVYRDNRGSTVLHSAAGRGQVEVVRYLLASFDIINCTDNQGNTALHVAASRGQVAVVETLLQASASSDNLTNHAGETFLHMAISGFQTPGFRRLDRQVEFMKQLACGKVSNLEHVINARNSEGRTALHTAIIANIHSDLIQLLMAVHSIDVNIKDAEGMTALDILKRRPQSTKSEILTRQLISAGGISGCADFTARRAIVSHLKMQGNGSSSPGTSFTVPDTEILLYTGIENGSDASVDQATGGRRTGSNEQSQGDLVYEHQRPSRSRKLGTVNNAAQQLKKLLQWTRMKGRKTKKLGDDDSEESLKRCSTSNEVPAPLRQRFSQSLALSNNKRILSVRSNQPSPVAKKRFASGLMHGVMQAKPHLAISRQSRSSSFSNSSPNSLEKQIGVYIANSDHAGPSSCPTDIFNDGAPNMIPKEASANQSLMNHYLCFGTTAVSVIEQPVYRQQQSTTYRGSVISVA